MVLNGGILTRINVKSQETETYIGRSTHTPTARTSKLRVT